MHKLFNLDITTINGAEASDMDIYAQVVKNSGLVVRSSLTAEGTVLNGHLTDTAVLADIRTVLSDHVMGTCPVLYAA